MTIAGPAEPAPLYGLVLTGGRSARMQTDKAALTYGGKPQSVRAFELLTACCEKVYLSNRADQADAPGQAGLPQLHDAFPGKGPLVGILTALNAHPDKAWLVTACDLPFLDAATLADLIRRRQPAKIATAYRSAHDGLPEPLCAIYEPSSREPLIEFTRHSVYCPRKALIQSDVHLLDLANPAALDNINHPEEYAAARRQLG